MTHGSLHSAATLGSVGSGSGLPALLPTSHCCPGPALAEKLALDPLRLCNGHHQGAAPAIALHPDVHLVELASVAPGQGIMSSS